VRAKTRLSTIDDYNAGFARWLLFEGAFAGSGGSGWDFVFWVSDASFWRPTMYILNRDLGRFPLGVWIALVAHLSLFLGWGMQAYSLLDWNGAVDLGLQNERFTGDAVERTWAQESWGVAVVDMLWPLPIGIVALVGILRKRLLGFVAGLMELSIGVYFPLCFAIQRWTTYPDTAMVALLLWTIPSLVGIMGLWVNHRFFEP
jgi:hypothetical protein